MNIWDDIEAQKFFSKEKKKKDIYPGENLFLSRVLFENCSILDIGCAQGGFYKILKSFVKSFRYTGIDTSEKMIFKAKKNIQK